MNCCYIFNWTFTYTLGQKSTASEPKLESINPLNSGPLVIPEEASRSHRDLNITDCCYRTSHTDILPGSRPFPGRLITEPQ